MLTTLLHFCTTYLATAGASSPPGRQELHLLATVQAAERIPPTCGHLHRAGPQTYLSWGLTRQGWRGGWDLTRWARSSCDEPFFCLLSISPTKTGESGQQRRQPAANASRMPIPNPQPRKVAVSWAVLWAEHFELSSVDLHCSQKPTVTISGKLHAHFRSVYHCF